MKYLKYSMLVLLGCVVCSSAITSAAPTEPISFTRDISYVTRENSPERTKINNNRQKVRVGMTNHPSTATFSAKFFVDGVTTETLKEIPINTTRESNKEMTKQQGDVYIQVWRDDSMIGTKKTTGFTYDPNGIGAI